MKMLKKMLKEEKIKVRESEMAELLSSKDAAVYEEARQLRDTLAGKDAAFQEQERIIDGLKEKLQTLASQKEELSDRVIQGERLIAGMEQRIRESSIAHEELLGLENRLAGEKEELLGGMRVEVGDEVLDTSYRSGLRKLESFLKQEK